MAQVSLKLNPRQIQSLLDQLDPKTRLKLVRETEQKTRREMLKPIVSELRRQSSKNPISDKEIREICEDVRQELYEKRNKSTRKNKSCR